MSFTIMHLKDGALVPIKMSIWDAFKGAPQSKSKSKLKPVSDAQSAQTQQPAPTLPEPCPIAVPAIAHGTVITPVIVHEPPPPEIYMSMMPIELANTAVECPCCQKIHLPDQRPEATKKDNKKQSEGKKGEKQDDKDSGKDGKEGNQFSTKDQETYSEDDDKKITELKGAGKSWQEILDAIGKTSKSQLQAHWKKMNSDDAGSKEKDDKKSDGKAEGKSKADDSEKKKADGQVKKKGQEDQSKKDTTTATGSAKKDAKKGDKIEVGELRSWSDRYDRQKWIAAASKHFDLTGQRITPDVARKLAEGK